MHDRFEEALRLMDRGASDKAERVLLGLLEEHPEEARSNYLMASLCDRRGQERRAVPFYRRTLAQPGNCPKTPVLGWRRIDTR
jgi:hypothetical protein